MQNSLSGDSGTLYIPPHPIRNNPFRKNITKFSGNVLYWTLQVAFFVLSLTFNVLCNPIVWFVLKTVFNILTEVFIYLVLGACSFLITLIAHLDDYYTKGKNRVKKYQENSKNFSRDGLEVQSCTVKRFVETPKNFDSDLDIKL